MALTKHFKKILKNSTLSIVSDPSYPYCMVEYYTGFGDSRTCETYYVLKSVLLPVLEQTKSIKTLLSVAKDNRLLGSDGTRLTEIPPITTTDTKSESCVIADSVGVVDSVGDALFSLTNADFRTIQKALLSYYHWTDNHDFCFGDDEEKKQQSLENIDRLRNLFINAEGLGLNHELRFIV